MQVLSRIYEQIIISQFVGSIAFNFCILFIGIMIGQVSISYVVMGYVSWILPQKDAKMYTSYYYAAWSSVELFGPLSAGFVSYYISNRMVFVCNFFMCLCVLIHSLLFILGKQKKIQNKQLDLMIIEEKEVLFYIYVSLIFIALC